VNGLRAAIGFLTVLPVAPRDAAGLSAARGWFPLAGLLLGLMLARADLLMHWGYPLFADAPRPFPSFLSAVILVALMACLTRALHLDGFMDCCDGLLGGFSRERRLEILRDSHVGAFAVVGAVCLFLVKIAAIMALPMAARFWILLLFPCLSRWAMLAVLEFFPYARPQGIGTPFRPSGGRSQLALGFAVALIAAAALAGIAGLIRMLAATLTGLVIGAWASRLLGGVTGDVYGAVNEAAEAFVLTLAAILAYAVSAAFLDPLHKMPWFAS